MNYDEFRRQLGKAGLTVKGFAELIGQTPNSVSNYAGESVPNHLAIIAALLGEMAERAVDYRVVLDRINLEPARPRGGAVKGRFGGSKQDVFSFEKNLGTK